MKFIRVSIMSKMISQSGIVNTNLHLEAISRNRTTKKFLLANLRRKRSAKGER